MPLRGPTSYEFSHVISSPRTTGAPELLQRNLTSRQKKMVRQLVGRHQRRIATHICAAAKRVQQATTGRNISLGQTSDQASNRQGENTRRKSTHSFCIHKSRLAITQCCSLACVSFVRRTLGVGIEQKPFSDSFRFVLFCIFSRCVETLCCCNELTACCT